MSFQEPLSFEQGKQRILDAIGEAHDLTFVRGFGNIGDLLIHAGVRQMLAGLDYQEISILDLAGAHGHTAVFPGAGGFCHAHHKIPAYISELETRFDRVIILPSTFDVTVECVRSYLQQTRAHVFARDSNSYQQIQVLCRADLSHDCAFFFNFEPYRRKGRGVLTACRTDGESTLPAFPSRNNDISLTCETLDEFLWTIARHELVRTDRAHVMIAAAMLGKRVEFWPSNYHKLPAIAELSLASYPVVRIDPNRIEEANSQFSIKTSIASATNKLPRYDYWAEWKQLAALDISHIVPPLTISIFVDGAQLDELPIYNRLFLPFVEHDGQYWGNPTDDSQAIMELERLRGAGAAFLIFAWTAFWWFDAYPDFCKSIRSRFPCRIDNERVKVFDLERRN
jgi:hypothetical protein